MIHRLVIALASMALIAGCKGKQSQSDQPIESAAVGTETKVEPAIEAAAMNFNPNGSDSGSIQGLKTIHFGYDKSNLDSQSKADLAANADWMKKNPSVKVQVEGHTDARGAIEYNVALGERRANSVKSYLVGLGVASDRLSVISYGEEKPLQNGESEDAYGKNRRANFLPLQ